VHRKGRNEAIFDGFVLVEFRVVGFKYYSQEIVNGVLISLEIAGFALNEALPFIGVSILNIVKALIALFVGIIIIKIVTGSIEDWMVKSGLSKTLTGFTNRLIGIILYIFVILVALTFLGLEMGAALVSIGAVLGFVIGFALKDTLGDIAAGFMLAIVKPFGIGDKVVINGKKGIVKGIGMSVTAIDTLDNKRVVIANGEVWKDNIINFTEHPISRVDMETGVSYDDDLDKVIRATMEVLEEDERVLSEPKPKVAVSEMGDSAITLIVRPWVKTEDYKEFYYDFQKAVKQKYDEMGIEIPYQQMDVHLEE